MPRKTKKILILTSSMGNGHLSPAEAVQQALNQLYPRQYKIEIIDILALLNKHINNITQKALYNAVQHAPYLYKLVYSQFDRKNQMKMLNFIQYPLIHKKIQTFLSKQNPDLILSTYPIWDYNIVKVNNRHKTPPPFISLITDSINVHSAWFTADVNYHFVPNQDTKKELIKAGIKANKIHVTGLPIRLQFGSKINKRQIFQEFHLIQNKKTIVFLVTAENTNKALKQLKEILKTRPNDNIIAVCGNNKKIHEKLSQTSFPPNVKICSFLKDLHKLIAVADIVISKAGGSIVQECIAMKKPIILSQIIPGHEEGNATLITKYKLGIDATLPTTSITQAIEKTFKDYDKFVERIKKHSKPKAALEASKTIHKLLGGKTL